jgi:endonuclease/exonuclease/phosphatase family metal-dependent hydrolase
MVNTHLDHESTTAQVEGMKLIEQKLLEYEWDYPLYLTGDFNVVSTDKALDGVREFMRNARTYATVRDTNSTVNGFGASSSRKQIDHIYYSDYLKAVEYYTIMDAYNGVTYVSDHYPIYAIIKLRK